MISHGSAYPHHWPAHPNGRKSSAPIAPERGSGTVLAGSAAPGSAAAPAVTPTDRGQLTAAPWIGLHYETEVA
jgi:hypothetical protein